jgi:hypothetical protein
MKKSLLMLLTCICMLTLSCKKDQNSKSSSTGEVTIQADGLMYDYEVVELLNDGSNKTGRVFSKKKHEVKFKETFTVKDNTILKLYFENKADVLATILVEIDYKGKHIYDKRLLQINEEVLLKLK